MFIHADRLDFSRHEGLLDHKLVAKSRITFIGVGGASGLAKGMAHCGFEQFRFVDFDYVGPTNPTTQSHDYVDIGRSKVTALEDHLDRINPHVTVSSYPVPYQDLLPSELDEVWSADFVLAMTDHFHTQGAINRDARARGVDAMFAACYIDCEGVEVTASFTDTIAAGGGCHRCHTKARYDGYDAGFENPTIIASYALAADYLNALIGNLVLGRLHFKAGSTLPIAELGRVFSERPCLISRISPFFGMAPGEAFAGREPMPFSSSLWALDTPPGWTCPDCGTTGHTPAPEFQRPNANPGRAQL